VVENRDRERARSQANDRFGEEIQVVLNAAHDPCPSHEPTGRPAGYTHEELSPVLRLRIHDTLLDLVEAGRIAREPLEGRYVYVSAAKRHARAQFAQRATLPADPPPPLDAARVIDVLIAVIRE